MTEPISEEIELTLLLSLPDPGPGEVVAMLDLLNTPLDWNQVLGMLTVHRTIGVAWHNIVRHAISQRRTLRPSYFLRSLMVTADGQRVKAREQLGLTARVQHILERAGVRSAVLKGAAVAEMAYPDLGMRMFNDNDLLIDRGQLASAVKVLEADGYVQGNWDYATAAIRPAPRREVLHMAVNSHQTYPYMKATPDAVMLECHRLDVHLSIDLMTGNHTDDAVGLLLDDRIDAGGLTALSATDMLIMTAVHFAREAVHRDEVLMLKDLVLNKLVDVVALLRHPDLGDVPGRADRLGLSREVYFALHYADEIFPGRVPSALLDRLRPDGLGYLDEVGNGRGVVHRWSSPVTQRFFDIHRLRELDHDLAAAAPGAGAVTR